MDEKDLKKFLRGRRTQPVRRGWRCPDEIELAAYVDHRLEGPTREFVEAHIADCDSCFSQVSFLLQAADSTESVEMPTTVLGRARNLVPGKSQRTTSWGWRWAAYATAASLVLFVVLIALRMRTKQAVNAPGGPLVAQQHQPDLVPFPQTTPALPLPVPSHPSEKPKSPAPTVRSEGQNLLPTILFPREGATLRRGELDFRWQPMADTVFYDIRILTPEGDLILESKTEDTHLQIADEVRLEPRAKYFVSIRAHLREGKTVQSSIVSFRISEQ